MPALFALGLHQAVVAVQAGLLPRHSLLRLELRMRTPSCGEVTRLCLPQEQGVKILGTPLGHAVFVQDQLP